MLLRLALSRTPHSSHWCPVRSRQFLLSSGQFAGYADLSIMVWCLPRDTATALCNNAIKRFGISDSLSGARPVCKLSGATATLLAGLCQSLLLFDKLL